MRSRDIVVVGASAGGVEALSQLVSYLPASFPGSILIVLHSAPTGASVLPDILRRAGPLPAREALDGLDPAPGHIYVAPRNQHLLVEKGRMRLSSGPRENGHRPAVDVLFRSAAVAYGPRTVGVVLSGNLDDGSAGLVAIKRHGGLAIAQDPDEALYPSMPRNAILTGQVDWILPITGIARTLIELMGQPVAQQEPAIRPSDESEVDAVMSVDAPADTEKVFQQPSRFVCPDCAGTLFQIDDAGLMRYRCRVGHAYSPQSLLAAKDTNLENALWTALRVLEEQADLITNMVSSAGERGFEHSVKHFEERLREVEAKAERLRDALRSGDVEGSTWLEDAGAPTARVQPD